MLLVGAAAAQQKDAAAPSDRFETARLVWTTLIAIDQANQTGNYSVLRVLAAPGFQKLNDPARLAGIFAAVREKDTGLGRVVLSAPVYSEPPAILENGLFRAKGVFPARPAGVAFELPFQNVEGRRRLFGVSISEAAAQAEDGALHSPQKKPAGSGG